MSLSFRQALLASAAALVLSYTGGVAARGEALCSLASTSYANAKRDYPGSAFAIAELEKHSIATWYSDRNRDCTATATQLVAACPESSRLSVVVYGLPNKDCEAGSSSVGSTVRNAYDYTQFLKTLIEIVGDRKTLYVLEPDAVGLLTKDGGCGGQAGYLENLRIAVDLLSANPNAEIYVDVGYWTLQHPESTARAAQVVRDLAAVGRVKGITLNASNYRSNAEISGLCSDFQQAIRSSDFRCIVDTSRNYNTPSTTEWCNAQSAGIGHPPTSETGFSNLDYFMWIKPPGESDGKCDTGSHTSDVLPGPEPGQFFDDSFKLLWNQGYFVNELAMPRIDGETFPPLNVPTSSPATQNPSAEVYDTVDATTNGSQSAQDPFTTPCPSRSSVPSDDVVLDSLRLQRDQVETAEQQSVDATESEQFSPKIVELLRLSDDDTNGGFNSAIGALPRSDGALVDETEDISSGSSVDLIALVKGLRGSGDSSASRSSSSIGDDDVKALSTATLMPAPSSADVGVEPGVSTASGTRGGKYRTEILASIGVLGVVGVLAVAMAVVTHKRRQEALMEARLSTPAPTIIHVTPASSI